MDIKIIGNFRFAIEDAINMIARLGGNSYALPSVEELDAMIQRLESTSPFDVIASILADNDYMNHKQKYLGAFGGVLDCEAFIGDIKADGRVEHYWDGLTEKLDASPNIDRIMYLAKIEKVNCLVQENIRGMKADLLNVFGGNKDQLIAQELLTDEAKELFKRALNKGLVIVNGDKYKWIDTASLYGYFVDKTSDSLNIRYSNNRVPWKKYEAIISNHSELLATARQAVNDYTNKELPPPEGDDKVDDICK